MKTIDLKAEVASAVGREWADFQRDHPHLAAALDQTLIIEEAASLLANDPEYRRVLHHAAATGESAEMLTTFVENFVAKWMKRLLSV